MEHGIYKTMGSQQVLTWQYSPCSNGHRHYGQGKVQSSVDIEVKSQILWKMQ
jgi:hypothetical protein